MFIRGKTPLLAALAVGTTVAALFGAVTPVQAAPHPSTGGLRSWGWNNFKQLGYPAPTIATLPRNVVPAASGPCDAAHMSSIKQIDAGVWSSMALLSDGIVCGWGRNDFGELGLGATSAPVVTPTPVCAPYATVHPCRRFLHASQIAVGGLFGVAIVAGIYHPNPFVALTGAVVSFGSAMTGELGQGPTFTDTYVPKLVCRILPVPNIGASCPRSDPSAAAFLSRATQVTAGEYNAAALVNRQEVTFGDNSWCQLGVGNFCTKGLPGGRRGPYTAGLCDVFFTESPTNCSPNPVKALIPSGVPIPGVTAISYGNSVNMVLLKTGQVMTFGTNYWDQLGNGINGNPPFPVNLPNICHNNNINLTVGCSWYARYVVSNPMKQSPCFSTSRRLSQVIAISAGFTTNLALLKDGIVCDWGFGQTYGNLGDGAFNKSPFPVAVCISCSAGTAQYLTGVTAISAGEGSNNLALVKNSVVRTWGDNQVGEQGQDAVVPAGIDRAVLVCTVGPPTCPTGPYLTGITQISSGAYQELALP